MRDITSDLRGRLPAPLLERLLAVENNLGHQVTFIEDEATPGGALGSASPDGIVRLTRRARGNFSVIGEEILHLHRHAQGYPLIEPGEVARRQRYARGLMQLAGHFDEFAFFPVLEGMGLDPRGQILPTLEPARLALENLLPEIQHDGPTDEWKVLLSVTHVQTTLLAPESRDRDEFLQVLNTPPLRDYMRPASRLADEVRAARDEPPDAVRIRMQRCLRDHLALPVDAATVR